MTRLLLCMTQMSSQHFFSQTYNDSKPPGDPKKLPWQAYGRIYCLRKVVLGPSSVCFILSCPTFDLLYTHPTYACLAQSTQSWSG